MAAFCTVNPSLRKKKGKRKAGAYMQIGIMEVIDAAQRGKGLGRRMLDQLVDITRGRGFECVQTFAIDGFVTDLSMVGQGMNVRFDL